MQKVYIISGLGVDERVFRLINFGTLKPEFINWIPPNPKESIQQYANRLSQKITCDQPIIIGLSFGGMIAVEIAKIITTQKVILLASSKTRKELPWYWLLAGKLRLNRLLPSKLLKSPHFFTYWLFGIQTDQEQELLKNILNDTDTSFLKWAIHEIVNWQHQENVSENMVHIHGSKDRILPLKYVKADYIIEEAGHFMTITHAKAIEVLIRQLCTSA